MGGLPALDLRGTRVLVVDDDADNREMLATVLADSGALVTTAESAAEALNAFERERPDIVISDIGLPGEDGFSLLRKLRALPGPDGRKVPAIALTGYGDAAEVTKADGGGFQAHLTKPAELTVILETVARVLRETRGP